MLRSLFKVWLSHYIRQGISRFFNSTRNRQALLFDELLQQGYQAQQNDKLEQAHKLYLKAYALQPKNVDIVYLLGTLYGQLNQQREAKEFLLKAISIKPDFADAHISLGNVTSLSGSLEEAIQHYQTALKLDSNALLAWLNIGRIYLDLDNPAEAIKCYETALSKEPNLPQALEGLVTSYIKASDFQAALDIAIPLAKKQQDNASYFGYLGYIYHAMLDYDKATKNLFKAIELDSGYSTALNTLGILYQDLGELEAAEKYYSLALIAKPDYYSAEVDRAMCWLLRGKYEEGWQAYELRKLSKLSKNNPVRQFDFIEWQGEPIKEGCLLIYAEQGLGDEIMFASCIPDTFELVSHCVIDCSAKLAPIFQRSFPLAIIHSGSQQQSDSWLKDYPQITHAIAIASLAKIFRSRRMHFPSHSGYLKAEQSHIIKRKKHLATLGNDLKIGISWLGGSKKSRKHLRSIDLECWLPILKLTGIQFISLQYGNCCKEIESMMDQHGICIHHWQEAIDDYDETATLVSSLDLVISVQTAIVHLAGGLGKEVWALIPVSPEWRYGMEGGTMPWYPSVQLIRQEKLFYWQDVIEKIAHLLSERLKNNQAGLTKALGHY